MLWVDKYRPTSLDKLDIHSDLAELLKKMVKRGDFPHILAYGASGSGKKTLIMSFLKEIYGSAVEKVKIDHKSFKVNGGTNTLEITMLSSNHHIEINPSDVGLQDRFLIQELLKEIAQNHPIDATSQKSFKVVILSEVDKLSKEAQHALRRTMEKYISSCRLILLCKTTSRVIDPIRSRCLPIRIPAPTHEEICSIIFKICKKEKLSISPELANQIAIHSERNLRRAILCLEATRIKHGSLQGNNLTLEVSDWETFISLMAKQIVEEQSPKCLLSIRGKFYELLSHCIPPEIILKKLTIELLPKLDSEMKFEVCKWAAHYEHQLQCGSKAIFHLEAFVAKFMSIYKKFLVQAFAF